MAHAINGYRGSCKNIHGHSYELHVTVASLEGCTDYMLTPGMVIDFKEVKKIVRREIIEALDHKIVLSHHFLIEHPALALQENLVIWESEPTVENMLIYIQRTLCDKMPAEISLVRLKLYETKDSYAEWTC
jgi:6-pyruvoyltetrahydropterin/6-carboxytetrahydropterin synthase